MIPANKAEKPQPVREYEAALNVLDAFIRSLDAREGWELFMNLLSARDEVSGDGLIHGVLDLHLDVTRRYLLIVDPTHGAATPEQRAAYDAYMKEAWYDTVGVG